MALTPIETILSFAESRPNHPAIVGARLNLNYKTFVATVKRFAAKLRSDGLRPGHVVGLRLRPELQAVAVAAVMHEGAISFAATSNIVESYSNSIDFVITDNTNWLSTKREVISVTADWVASLGSINSQIQIQDFASTDSLALLVFFKRNNRCAKGCRILDRLNSKTN